MAELSSTGKWVDKKTGDVVDSEPEEGRLLVSPGGELTPNVKAQIERLSSRPRRTLDVSEVKSDKDESEPETASLSAAPEVSAESGRTGKARQSR